VVETVDMVVLVLAPVVVQVVLVEKVGAVVVLALV
jgi:hypothetical protein